MLLILKAGQTSTFNSLVSDNKGQGQVSFFYVLCLSRSDLPKKWRVDLKIPFFQQMKAQNNIVITMLMITNEWKIRIDY